jgi:hypothetical protein
VWRSLAGLLAIAASLLGGCAATGERLTLVLPAVSPMPRPADAPRLAVAPLQDWRDQDQEAAREGLFREMLPEDAVEGGLTRAATVALADRVGACGRFAEVTLGKTWSAEPGGAESAAGIRPVDLLLEGEIATFYAERDTIKHPFISMVTAPLSIPLAALSGLRLLPGPTLPFLPVTYRSTLTLQLRLREVGAGAPVWERTVEGTAELEISTGAEFFEGKSTPMRDVATAALQKTVDQAVRSLPSADWLRARKVTAPGGPEGPIACVRRRCRSAKVGRSASTAH